MSGERGPEKNNQEEPETVDIKPDSGPKSLDKPTVPPGSQEHMVLGVEELRRLEKETKKGKESKEK